jgi:DNA-binding IclR family transcriptional regulator
MSSSSVKSADRTLAVLTLLGKRHTPVPTMAIARQCEIPKSSAHHLLNVMRDRGWVAYHKDRRGWTLGASALRLHAHGAAAATLRRLSDTRLTDLARATDDTAHLATLDGPEAVYVAKADPPQPSMSFITDVGLRLPAHLTAVGKAALSALEPAAVHAIYGCRPLPRFTNHGPTNLGALEAELDACRTRGFAIEVSGITPGVGCVATPVVGVDGALPAAVGVSFSRADRTTTEIERAAERVMATAHEIERCLAP